MKSRIVKLIKIAFVLGLTYALTWSTIAGINSLARFSAREAFHEEIRWAKTAPGSSGSFEIPTTIQLLSKARDGLEPFDLGCKSSGEIPKSLAMKEWNKNPAEDDILGEIFFIKKPEDKFDEWYANYLHIPLQPIEREKNVRNSDRLHFKDLLAKEKNDKAREQILRHFSNVYGSLGKLFPCRIIRWINGWVQVTAFAVFWLTVLVVIGQWWTRVRGEKRLADRFFPIARTLADGTPLMWSERPGEGNWLTPTEIDVELESLYAPEVAKRPGSVALMLREVYETYLKGSLNLENFRDVPGASAALEQAAHREHHKIESNMAILTYLGWSLPSLGFVGTVLGLGTALLTAGDMVTPNSELQRDAIQSVSIYLGRAFDKTFVALMLSLVQMALIYGVRRAQETVVFDFQDKIARGVVSRLKH